MSTHFQPILQEGTFEAENADRWAENQTWPWPRPSGNQKLRPFVRNAADNAYRSSEIQHRERENGDRSSEMHRKSPSGTRTWTPFVINAADNAHRVPEHHGPEQWLGP